MTYDLLCFNRKEHKDRKDQLLNAFFSQSGVHLFHLCSCWVSDSVPSVPFERA